MSKQELVADILAFLQKSSEDGTVSSDDKESLEVAIDAISECFGVTAEDSTQDLLQIYSGAPRAASTTTSNDSSAAAIASAFASGSGAASSSANAPTEEEKSKAEALKIEGNKAMAVKNYDEALQKYTEAIELNPNNPLYYSNRAAAYSQVNKPSQAATDARRAISLDPTYSKAYSRLGLALYALGDTQGSLNAYEQGLRAEGDSPSEGMKRGYETVKSRVENDNALAAKSGPSSSPEASSQDSGAATPTGAGGIPGLGNLGGLSELLGNPEIRKMAQSMMSNPSMQNLMNSPTARNLAESVQSGNGGPDIAKLMSDPTIMNMMQDPMFQNMANMFTKK